jgi:hypothetical protein
MAHPELVYKKLDEAALGYEEAKRWVVSNVSEVLHYIDELRGEVNYLSAVVHELEKSSEG